MSTLGVVLGKSRGVSGASWGGLGGLAAVSERSWRASCGKMIIPASDPNGRFITSEAVRLLGLLKPLVR